MAVYTRHRRPIYDVTAVGAAAQTVVPDGVGDVTVIAQVCYVVQEITGGGSGAGVTTCVPGAVANIYNDGVDIVQFQVAANGAVTVQRTAGADTFNVRLAILWL